MLQTRVHAFFDEPTSTLTYIAWRGADAVVIDPVLGYDARRSRTSEDQVDQITAFLDAKALSLRGILETHAHADHFSGAQRLRARTGAPVAIGSRIREVQHTFKELLRLSDAFSTDGRPFDRLLSDSEIFEAGELQIQTIATPGHTPACVSYLVDDALFTGDALFMDDYGTGRADFPGGSARDLYHSIRQRLYTLVDETRVFVGHDYKPGGRKLRYETTIGAQKARNPQLAAHTDEEAFIELRTARDATLAAPTLLWPSLQVNIRAGLLPPLEGGTRFFKVPLNAGDDTEH